MIKRIPITIHISEADLQHVQTFLDLTKIRQDGSCSDGALDLNALATMLINDVAHVIRRPGSWEGANMIQVLHSHGYPV